MLGLYHGYDKHGTREKGIEGCGLISEWSGIVCGHSGASEWEAMSLVLKMAQKLPDQSVDSVYIMAEPLSVAPALKNVIAG